MPAVIIVMCLVGLTLGIMYLMYHAKTVADKQLEASNDALVEIAQTAVALKTIAKKLADLPKYMGYDRIVEFISKHLGDKYYNAVKFTHQSVAGEAFLASLLKLGWVIRYEWKVVETYEPQKVFMVLAKNEEDFVDGEPTTEAREKLVILQANYAEIPLENCEFIDKTVTIDDWKGSGDKIPMFSEFVAYVPSDCEEFCQRDALLDATKAAKEFAITVKMARKVSLKETAPTYIYDKDSPNKFAIDSVRLYLEKPSLSLSYPQITADGGKKMVNLEKFLDLAVSRMKKAKTNFALFGPPNAGKSSILRELIFRAYNEGITVVKATGAQFGAIMNDATAKVRLGKLGEQVLVVIDEASGFSDDLAQIILSATEGLNDANNVSIVLCTNTEESMGDTHHEALLRAGRMAALLHVNALTPDQWKPLLAALKKLHPDETWETPADQSKDYLLGEVYSWGKDPLLGDEWLKDALK